MSEPARFAVSNQKGGVGKTTTAINVAGALSLRGHDVLFVDLDPQGNATTSLGHGEYFDDLRIENTLDDLLTAEDIEAAKEYIDDTIVSLEEFDLLRANEGMNESLRSDLNSVTAPEKRLMLLLEEIEQEYDYVIVDAPPSLDKITTNALVYTKNILVPTYPERMSTGGLSILADHVKTLQQYYEDVGYLGFVVNRIEDNNEAAGVIATLDDEFADILPIWKVRSRVALRRAISDSNGSIFNHNEEDEFVLTYFDMAAWIDDYFDLSSEVGLLDAFSEEKVVDAVVDGMIDPDDLEFYAEEVAEFVQKQATEQGV